MLPFDSKYNSSFASHAVFCKKREFSNKYANPCIAASCGSLYGCEQNQERVIDEKNRELNKCTTKKEKKKVNKRYKDCNRYPGQTHNPIVSLWYDQGTKAICASQALV